MLKDQSNSILIAGIEYNSIKFNMKNDCKLNRIKFMSFTIYKKSMGKGEYVEPITPKFKWTYPNPNSTTNLVLKTVCTH